MHLPRNLLAWQDEALSVDMEKQVVLNKRGCDNIPWIKARCVACKLHRQRDALGSIVDAALDDGLGTERTKTVPHHKHVKEKTRTGVGGAVCLTK